jgi:hypothetical protein
MGRYRNLAWSVVGLDVNSHRHVFTIQETGWFFKRIVFLSYLLKN